MTLGRRRRLPQDRGHVRRAVHTRHGAWLWTTDLAQVSRCPHSTTERGVVRVGRPRSLDVGCAMRHRHPHPHPHPHPRCGPRDASLAPSRPRVFASLGAAAQHSSSATAAQRWVQRGGNLRYERIGRARGVAESAAPIHVLTVRPLLSAQRHPSSSPPSLCLVSAVLCHARVITATSCAWRRVT